MIARARTALRDRMRTHVTRTVASRQRVLVALSGGLDSVTLLHLLRFHSDCDVVAAHFDHAMRPTSAADAAWVRGVCHAWGVPLDVARAEIAPTSEAAARELRYRFLMDAADAAGATAVLTAHHADDQAETVLFRLARGTGLAGLAGIPVRRGIILRPLLPFTRSDLEQYAAAHGLRWRDDPSNLDLRFARNRIRHRVLPELERARPGATRRIARLAAAAASAERAWRRIIRDVAHDVVIGEDDGAVLLARSRLLSYSPHLRARVLRHVFQRLGFRLDRSATAVAMRFIASGASGRVAELTGGLRLEREFDRFRVWIARPELHTPDTALRIMDMGPGTGAFVAGGRRYVARWAPVRHAVDAGHTASFDSSSLRFPLELRAWRAGDRIRLTAGSRKLKRLFQEHRVARARRASVPVLSDAAGVVLWAAGLARSTEAMPVQGRTALEIMVADGDTE